MESWHEDIVAKAGGQAAGCNWILFFSLSCSNTNFDYSHASPQKAKKKCMEENKKRQGWKGLRGTVFTLLKRGEWNYSSLEKPGTHFNSYSTPLHPFPLNLGPRSLSLSYRYAWVKNGGSFPAHPHYFQLYNLEPWYTNKRLFLKYFVRSIFDLMVFWILLLFSCCCFGFE